MEWPAKIAVTGQEIDISWLTAAQRKYYKQLAARLLARYQSHGAGRQLYTLSGPAGAGKSVTTALLEHLFADAAEFRYVNLGLDAFHYKNTYLEERGLKAVKGRYDTYNTDELIEKLQQFKDGVPVSLPIYSRQLHEPIQNRIEITDPNVLLLLEGQWLLRDESTWTAIRAFSNYNLFVAGAAEALRENVTKRHIRGGRTPEDAFAYYEKSDLPNTQEVLTNKIEPDETLFFYKDIDQ